MFGFRLLLTTNSIGMINFSESEIAANYHHWSLAYRSVRGTFVIKHEEPYEGRPSSTVP